MDSRASYFFSVLRYVHGKPVQGHMNITFTYYYHGMEDVLYEDKMVSPGQIT